MEEDWEKRATFSFLPRSSKSHFFDCLRVCSKLFLAPHALSRLAKLGVSYRVKDPVGRKSAMIFCKSVVFHNKLNKKRGKFLGKNGSSFLTSLIFVNLCYFSFKLFAISTLRMSKTIHLSKGGSWR